MRTLFKSVLLEKKDVALTIICGYIAGIAAIALFAASGYLISKAALLPPLYTLMILIACVKLLGFLAAFSRYGERFFSHRATFTMLSNLRVSFYQKIEPLAATIFQRFQSGDLLARIVGDIESLQHYFLRVLYPPVVLLFVFMSTVTVTAYFSPVIALILCSGFILTVVLVPFGIAVRQRKIYDNVRKSRGKLSTQATEFFYGFRELKANFQVNDKADELQALADTYVKEQKKNDLNKLYSETLNVFVSQVVTWAVLAVGAYFVSVGELDGVYLAMFVMIAITLLENTTPMAAFPSYMEDTKEATQRLEEVVKEKREAEGEERLPVGTGIQIDCSNVSFRYEGSEREVVRAATFSIPAGSKTAIVGPSGSGKSTLLYLLMKLHPATQGEIRLNDVSIVSIAEAALWEQTNVVLQANHFFAGSIRDNLLLAKDGLTDDEMKTALADVELGHFSLDDIVLEKGENLSGGEKQRLAIARAMLKKAPLWLLDEPTSSLDSVTERKVYTRLFELAKDDTLVLVSHRLSEMDKMDQIIVMDEGNIIEMGTYNELMAQQGYFYKLKKIEETVLV